jgi:hypothetical protein
MAEPPCLVVAKYLVFIAVLLEDCVYGVWDVVSLLLKCYSVTINIEMLSERISNSNLTEIIETL